MTDFGTEEIDVLTDIGWKPIKMISVNDKVWTLDLSSRKANLELVKSIKSIKVEPIFRISGKNIFGEFPDNNKILIEDRYGKLEIVHISDIFNNRIRYSHSSIPKIIDIQDSSSNDETFIIPGVIPKRRYKNKVDTTEDLIFDRELLCKILGLWLAEGGICGSNRKEFRPRRIVITQSIEANSEKCKQIDDLWDEIPKDIVTSRRIYRRKKLWYIHDARLVHYFHSMGNIYTKKIPNAIFDFNKKDLEQLLFWFALGDGRSSKHRKKYNNIILDNYKDIFSVSRELTEGLSYIALKCGIGISNYRKITEKDYMFASHLIKAEDRKPLNFVSLNANKNISLKYGNLNIERDKKTIEYIKLETNSPVIYIRSKGKSYWTVD